MKKYSPHLSLAAGTVAGIAMWISRASFDVAGTTANPERVAMLPSLAELLGFVVMALLICAGIALLARAGMQSTRNAPASGSPSPTPFSRCSVLRCCCFHIFPGCRTAFQRSGCSQVRRVMFCGSSCWAICWRLLFL